MRTLPTRKGFAGIRAEVVRSIRDAVERKRVGAVSFEQALLNYRDGLPLFGWPPEVPQAIREAFLAECGYRPQTVH